LTKDTQKVLKIIYKEYKKRIKQGEPKSKATIFSLPVLDKLFSKYSGDNIEHALYELKTNDFINLWIIGSFDLTDKAIEYCESHFLKKLSIVSNHFFDLISKFFSIFH